MPGLVSSRSRWPKPQARTARSSPSSATHCACADAQHNAAGLANLRVIRADVTPGLVTAGLGDPDIVVLDPAREGAGQGVARALAARAATLRRIVYVACDPASFARDLRVLLDEGWRLVELRGFDIFPMTEHVELVAALEPPGP